jgi:Ca2+-binding EF-hand superfamily protein
MPEDMSTKDLLQTLAACRLDEGFTKEEVAAAREVFGELEQDRCVSEVWGPLAKASSLLNGLIKFSGFYSGFYSMDYRDSLMDILPSCSTEQQGVCFHEFLIWARRLRDPMMQEMSKCFRDFETSGSGLVHLDGAISIAGRMGISLLTDAVDELLSDLGWQKDTTIDFDALVTFIDSARVKHGFSRSETEEFTAAFENIDYDRTGELNHFQVLDMLRYLGHTTSVKEANPLIKQVDFNESGSMDLGEVLRLMRLIREQDAQYARKAFNELRNSSGRLSVGFVQDALAKLDLFPQDDMLGELLQDMPADVCFTSFMHLNVWCRFRMNIESRKRGGFSQETILKIAELWRQGSSSRQLATVGELLWMFYDSQEVPVNTSEGQQQLQRRVRAAREAAIAAGVPEEEVEVSRGGTTGVGFYTFVHLIRGFVRDSEQEVSRSETEAVSLTRFPNSKAAEFRCLFSDFAEREAKESSFREELVARKEHLADRLLACLTMVPAISQSAMPVLLKSMGVKVPLSKLGDLNQFLARTRTSGEAHERTVQFATFLKLLRWMFDTDFAGVCSVMGVPGGPLSGRFHVGLPSCPSQ